MTTFFQKHRYSTEIFYNKSLSLILKANCSSFHCTDGRCVYFCNKALNIKNRLSASRNVNKQKITPKPDKCTTKGKLIKKQSEIYFFLEDDLNNDTLQFYIALERFNITSGILYKAESNLKSRYSARSTYQIDKYFNKLTEQR